MNESLIHKLGRRVLATHKRMPMPSPHRPTKLAPAMNTLMWDSPFTARHMHACAGLGMHSIGPIAKRLACGDDGTGAMAEPADIADRGRALLGA